MKRRILVVCGLRSEARIARGPGVITVAGGGDATFLAAGIERAIAGGASAILSFGIAGGLAAVSTGTLLVADAVVIGERRHWTDPAWSARLIAATGARRGMVASGDAVVATVEDKLRLHAATGAVAVDMESHVAARLAERHRLPFAVLRAVADASDRALPHAALVAMKPGGGIDLPAVVRSLFADRRQVVQLLAVARDSRVALDRLRDGRRSLGDGLGRGLDDANLR